MSGTAATFAASFAAKVSAAGKRAGRPAGLRTIRHEEGPSPAQAGTRVAPSPWPGRDARAWRLTNDMGEMEMGMAMMEMLGEQRQTQTVSPRLQHAVRLLQMSSLDFAAMVRDSLSSNPFLEAEELDDRDAELELPMAALQPDAQDSETAPAEAADLGPPPDDDREIWQVESRHAANGDDTAAAALEAMPLQTTLGAHLHGQLNVLPLMPRDLALGRVVESLDDDGYLRTPLDELIDTCHSTRRRCRAELQIALKRVQSLDPAGVGARSVGECLMLQLPAIDCQELRAPWPRRSLPAI